LLSIAYIHHAMGLQQGTLTHAEFVMCGLVGARPGFGKLAI
jgi:hypothetical protein